MKSISATKNGNIMAKIRDFGVGHLIFSDETVDIRADYTVDTKLPWYQAHKIIEEAAEEISYSVEYVAEYAKKYENGVFPVDVDNKQVHFMYVEGGNVPEFIAKEVVS